MSTDVPHDTLRAALRELGEIVGSKHVDAGDDVPERLGNATFDLEAEILGRARPANADQIRAALQTASSHDLDVYPISRGRNWGYGHIRERGAGIILDLSRMDRIVDFDARMGYVSIQPGVTYRQLYEFLEPKDSEWMAPSHHGPKSSSPIGNRLERGIERFRKGHHTAPVTNFEVLLPTGETFQTNRFQGSHDSIPPIQSVTFGPDTKELFAQSNLGVVTQATFLLRHQPEDVRFLEFQCHNNEDFGRVVEALRELKLNGRPGWFSLGNRHIAHMADRDYEYPWDEWGDTYPPPEGALDDYPRWQGLVILRGPDRRVNRAHAKCYKRHLAPHADLSHYGSTIERLLHLLAPPANVTGIGADFLEDALGSFRRNREGKRDWIYKKALWWRKRDNPPDTPGEEGDPAADECGLIWVAPLVPIRWSDIRAAANIIRDVSATHDFPPLITMQPLSNRSMFLLQRLLYDRARPEREEAAQRASRELIRALHDEGYLLYRYPVTAMDDLPQATDDWPSVIRGLKRALDPMDVLAPGRYDFRSQWPDAED